MPTTQEKIDANERETTTQLQLADIAIRGFIAASADALKDQALPIAKMIGRAQPQVSQTLNASKFNELIAEIKVYSENTATVTEQAVYKKSAWRTLGWRDATQSPPHIRLASSLGAHDGLNKNVSHHLFDAIKPLGGILARFGFATADHSRGELEHFAVFSLFEWSSAMHSKYNLYTDICDRLRQLDIQLQSLKKHKAQEASDSLWDSV